MIDYVNNYLLLTRDVKTHISTTNTKYLWAYQPPRKAMTCVDGCVLSVQVGESNYCTPKNNDGPWTTVEVMRKAGICLTDLNEWYPYDSDGVYAYVPVNLVNREIAAHGGLGIPKN